MYRQTSKEALDKITQSGVLGRRQLEAYCALYEIGPCTASELFYYLQKSRNPSHSNVTTRLGELRDMGVVKETGKRDCKITGHNVIEWDVTDCLPTKFDRPKRIKCKSCDGKGYHETTQTKLF